MSAYPDHSNDELFFVYLNGKCVGLTTRSIDKRVQRQMTLETIAKAMGFETIKEYLTTLPGYGSKERLRYFRENDRWGKCIVEKSKMKKQSFALFFERPDYGDGKTIKDGMLTRLSVFYSWGNGLLLLILPTVKDLKSLASFKRKHYNTDLYICSDWIDHYTC